MDVGKDADVGFANAIAGMIDKGGGNFDVHVQGSGIGKIAEAGVVGHHGVNGAIVFKDGRLSDGNFFKFERYFIFVLNLSSQHSHAIGSSTHKSIGGGGGETGGGRQRRTRARQGNFRRAI